MKKRIAVILLLVTMANLSVPMGVDAAVNTTIKTNTACAIILPDEQQKDIIETKFRMHNHVLEYRRWNASKGYWVDPDWIPVP